MITAMLLAAQLTVATPDCVPVPLPPAILKHVHRKAHAAKPHAKRAGQKHRKARRKAPAIVPQRCVVPNAPLDFTADLAPLEFDTLQQDAPPPFTPAEAYADEVPVAYWDDHTALPNAPGGYARAYPPAPPVVAHSVPEPGPLGLMAVAALGILACIWDGRRHGR